MIASLPRAGRSPRAALAVVAATVLGALAGGGCGSKPAPGHDADAVLSGSSGLMEAPSASVPAASSSGEPVASVSASSAPGRAPLLCPVGMASIPESEQGKAFCIDQYEASLVDKATGVVLSPYYPPHRTIAVKLAERWEQQRFEKGSASAKAMPLPPLPAPERARDLEFMAVSRPGLVPHGYMSGLDAEAACKNAGKRLCQHAEWVRACRGKQNRAFPYGDTYQRNRCNVCRSAHPAVVLHDDASRGHLDPRLNQVCDAQGEPLLLPTGSLPACASDWGARQVYDMNGNLDEWVDDEHGRFAGGFYARGRKDGCQASITAHPKEYFDYSTGTRCCLSRDD